jgi:hypothetical protein
MRGPVSPHFAARAAALVVVLAALGCARNGGAAVGPTPGTGGAEDDGANGAAARGTSRRIRDLVAGGGEACVILTKGSIACWKLELGERRIEIAGDSTSDLNPPMVATGVRGLPPGRIVSASVFGNDGCAVAQDGTVGCWRHEPLPLKPGPTPATTVDVHGIAYASIAPRVTYAIRADGAVWSWGRAFSDQFGDATLQMAQGPHPDLARPAPMGALHDVWQIAGDDDHACALLFNGSVECWGDNEFGELGVESPKRSAVPLPVAGLGHVLALSVGYDRTCALVDDGHVWCWGLLTVPVNGARDSIFPHADGEAAHHVIWTPFPIQVPGVENAVNLTSSVELNCIRDSSSQIWCWGGRAWSTRRVELTQLPVSSIAKVVASEFGACTLDTSDHVVCFEVEDARFRPGEAVQLPL